MTDPGALDLLRAALDLARRGIPVFPVVPGEKRPLIQGGRNAASLNPDRVREWWEGSPRAGIGVPTGPESGWAVLDIDRDARGADTMLDLVARHGRPPDTARQRTRSGGWHLIFRYPPPDVGEVRSRAGHLGAGIDTRGRGGYVIVAPTPGYTWLAPPWEVEPAECPVWMIDPPHAARPPRVTVPRIPLASGGTPYGLAALRAELARLRAAPVGTRNHALNVAAYSVAALAAGGELALDPAAEQLARAAYAIGLGAREIEKTLASGFKAGFENPRQAPDRASW